MPAIISQITRSSLHDGPGIRSVVYLKGCNLRCLWCHNPETQSGQTELLERPERCIQCGRCLAACPWNCRTLSDGQMVWQRDQCRSCMRCADVCPNEAIVICGETMTEQDVFTEISKDQGYYQASGGGVTFSGGECLLYPEFVRSTALLCRETGIHTAVESALSVSWSAVAQVIDVIDLFMVDIKHPDNAMHQQLTGGSNRLVLDNIARLSACHQAVQIRIPLIPSINDDSACLTAIADFINTCGPGIQSVELLRYNTMGQGKYLALGRSYQSFAENPQDDAAVEASASFLRSRLREKMPVIY